MKNQLMIAADILRGRLRESFENPSPVKPGVVTLYQIDLHTNDHMSLKDHSVVVQIQSTWFPRYDRNPQTFCQQYLHGVHIGVSKNNT